VCTEGQLIVDFTFDELIRIKHWSFTSRKPYELIPRSAIAIQQDPNLIDKLSKNITVNGLTRETIHFLKLSTILEPMQELMARYKTFGIAPRDCLRTALFQKWQRMNPNNNNNTNSVNNTTNSNNINPNLNNNGGANTAAIQNGI
jgi:hypothetical protein